MYKMYPSKEVTFKGGGGRRQEFNSPICQIDIFGNPMLDIKGIPSTGK